MRGGFVTSSGRRGVTRSSSTSVFTVNMSSVSGSACSAFGSRSVDSCSALKPSVSVRLESWHERHSLTDGMLWRLPSTISAMFGMPVSEASSASRCDAFHAYDANTQLVLLVRQRNLVSTFFPLNENSFQNLVP